MTHSYLKINQRQSTETIDFAVAELSKYLKLLVAAVTVEIDRRLDSPVVGKTIRVGLFTDFPELNLPTTIDSEFDDAILVNVQNGEGIIAGVNQRSVLLSVYRFLTELGCRWVRPGSDGELIPERTISQITVAVNEKPAYRHRGLCIEGAVSSENLTAIIDWLPKMGYNSYFIQFREAYTFLERWYAHTHNPLQPAIPFGQTEARRIVAQAEVEIRKRDLIYHAVGHGWTCEPFGIPGLSWEQKVTDVAPETAQYLALINGKRSLWGDVPLNTNLCYSNPQVRKIMIDDIVGYIRGHEVAKMLHLWLADGTNNHCECSECQKARPADFYVQLLNELDNRLTAEGLTTKIVFLIYVDLLWPPEVQRLINQERFSLMFAPITRQYDRPFEGLGQEPPLSQYVRNHLKFPATVAENLAYLKAWQKIFDGDSFSFEYHLMWAHYLDWSYCKTARVLCEDIKNLKQIGLNGLISCQVQRSFAPTGLPNYVMAQTLWNDQLSFEQIVADYFTSAFGPDGEECWKYLSQIPDLINEIAIWSETIEWEPIVNKLATMGEALGRLSQLAAVNRDLSNPVQAQSWRYLQFSLEVSVRFREILLVRAGQKPENVAELWEQLKQYIREREAEVQSVFDVFEFIQKVEVMNRQILNL